MRFTLMIISSCFFVSCWNYQDSDVAKPVANSLENTSHQSSESSLVKIGPQSPDSYMPSATSDRKSKSDQKLKADSINKNPANTLSKLKTARNKKAFQAAQKTYKYNGRLTERSRISKLSAKLAFQSGDLIGLKYDWRLLNSTGKSVILDSHREARKLKNLQDMYVTATEADLVGGDDYIHSCRFDFLGCDSLKLLVHPKVWRSK